MPLEKVLGGFCASSVPLFFCLALLARAPFSLETEHPGTANRAGLVSAVGPGEIVLDTAPPLLAGLQFGRHGVHAGQPLGKSSPPMSGSKLGKNHDRARKETGGKGSEKAAGAS